eukprot:CAMPEP_0203892070 /NCGR_PEP_ID=MMETSP0359-20131031/35273_1 /ASSEMBLY_ACC=CAM_ASM_000338 /TAXON_ID=268821 /ORGANISM="Scrippsiella Hangoei, Strain SHTV-5" /LENGTH=196 /DNA_ID=CAMNT_0050813953 /DNA_START=548 /DNA_END=1138 /DNA_ORIENTATION=-
MMRHAANQCLKSTSRLPRFRAARCPSPLICVTNEGLVPASHEAQRPLVVAAISSCGHREPCSQPEFVAQVQHVSPECGNTRSFTLHRRCSHTWIARDGHLRPPQVLEVLALEDTRLDKVACMYVEEAEHIDEVIRSATLLVPHRLVQAINLESRAVLAVHRVGQHEAPARGAGDLQSRGEVLEVLAEGEARWVHVA